MKTRTEEYIGRNMFNTRAPSQFIPSKQFTKSSLDVYHILSQSERVYKTGRVISVEEYSADNPT